MKNFTQGQFIAERRLESICIDGEPFRVELYWSSERAKQPGRVNLAYRFYHGESKIFEGLHFSPAPSLEVDGDESFGALLGFLSLQPGDTDDDTSRTTHRSNWRGRLSMARTCQLSLWNWKTMIGTGKKAKRGSPQGPKGDAT